jgi:3',5'-cyclic AMP phosphodiesterase CpdA
MPIEKNSKTVYFNPMHFVKPNPADERADEGTQPAPGEGSPFLLAHLSDPHLSSLAGVRLVDLLSKRLLGYLSWRIKRRRIHSPLVLEALLRDLEEVAPDHVALTGDLTHLGLPDEFRQAALWLGRLGPPERVTVVPGNHDAYVASPFRDTLGLWAPCLAGDEGLAGEYPSLRLRGPLALIGLSSARPSPPFFAVGSLGEGQLARFEKLLEETGRRGLLRIVLVHHPPVPGSISRRKRLTDASLFAEVLSRQGAELILHGHSHISMAHVLVAGSRRVPVFGAPSASYSGSDPRRSARYNLFRFERRTGGWALILAVRAYSHLDGRFVAAEEKEFLLENPSL